jgi:hypothetical protein
MIFYKKPILSKHNQKNPQKGHGGLRPLDTSCRAPEIFQLEYFGGINQKITNRTIFGREKITLIHISQYIGLGGFILWSLVEHGFHIYLETKTNTRGEKAQ